MRVCAAQISVAPGVASAMAMVAKAGRLPAEFEGFEHRQKEEFQGFHAPNSRRRAGITTFLSRNSRNFPLSGRSLDDLESELCSFRLETLDLQLAVLKLVERGSSVHVFHPITQHAVDQAG